MKEIYIKKIAKSYTSDAFNNDQYAYYFRYYGPDSHGYLTIMTEEAYMRLREVLKSSNKLIESTE